MGCCGGGKVANVPEGVQVPCAGGRTVTATSGARILARRYGVDLCDCAATGRGGSIVNEADVLRKAGVRP
jgi:pyruvate/2-oxoglutarate dehydrogenase complex dihydrolipoamide acyltransferase (E2) component